LIVRRIADFTRKITEENREKIKLQAVLGIDSNWNHRRTGPAHILEIVDFGNGWDADFEIVRMANTSGRDNHQGSTNEMGVEALKWVVKRWEDDHNVAVVLMDQDSRMAKVICESRWNVRHEHDANHTKGYSTAIVKKFQVRSDNFCTGSGSALATGLIMPYINLSPVTRRLKCGRTPSITIASTTPSVAIQHIRAINGHT
jgi:hypothetical protein